MSKELEYCQSVADREFMDCRKACLREEKEYCRKGCIKTICESKSSEQKVKCLEESVYLLSPGTGENEYSHNTHSLPVTEFIAF